MNAKVILNSEEKERDNSGEDQRTREKSQDCWSDRRGNRGKRPAETGISQEFPSEIPQSAGADPDPRAGRQRHTGSEPDGKRQKELKKARFLCAESTNSALSFFYHKIGKKRRQL